MDFAGLFENLPALTITGIALGSVYALVALGYTMVYGVLQLINFAHSEVFMFGTFATLWVFVLFGAGPDTSGVMIFVLLGLALVAAMLTSGLVALLVERVAYRPLLRRGAPKLIALISAIGASFVLAEVMGLRGEIAKFLGLEEELKPYVERSRDTAGMPVTIPSVGVVEVGGYMITSTDLLIVFSALFMMLALDQFVRRTRLGRGMRAVSQDPETAALMGVNPSRVVQMTFFIGGLMAGAAAVLYMIRIGATRFDAGFLLGVKAFTAAVLGGIGNLRGALLGGLVLGVTENYGAALFGNQWRDVVAFSLLVLVLLFRPTGLLGESVGRSRA